MKRKYVSDAQLKKWNANDRFHLKETAKIIGCTQAEVRKAWEHIDRTIGAKAAREIAKELKVPLAEVREILLLKRTRKRKAK